MIDLDHLRRIKLAKWPPGQVLLANTALAIDYNFPRRTRIEIEGTENLPRDRGVLLAMNHTDRYNYWPFQYGMYRRGGLRFTATWVKGKYYGGRLLGRFFDAMNNIPLPSRGYVLTIEFRKARGEAPGEQQYRLLRDVVDGTMPADDARLRDDGEVASFLDGGLRDLPGETFVERFDCLFDRMCGEVIALTRRALGELELNILVFPQGTRSIRLGPGHTGLAEMAQHLGAPIVPVGSNGSERLYPGNSPFSKGGHVVYRVGRPLDVDGPELAPYRVPSEVVPLTRAAADAHGDRYQAITDIVMDKINELLDPRYRSATEESEETGGDERGVDRFV